MSAGLGVGSLAASHPGSGSHHGSSHHGNSAFQMGALQQALPSVQTGSPTSDSFVGELSPPCCYRFDDGALCIITDSLLACC